MTKAVDLLLESFKRRFGKYPNVVQFDEGKEFYNVGVRNLLKSHDVNYFSTQSDKKAAIVVWKYFYSKGTYNWVDTLDELTENYNNTKHSSILMKPRDVNKTNENLVWFTLYVSPLGKLPLQKFRVGDTVRVSRYKSIFGKGYEANFTEEIFKVKSVLRGGPTVYELEGSRRRAYHRKVLRRGAISREQERQHVQGRKNTPKKNGMALVKWLGYDSRSWVPIEDIKDIE